MLFTSQADRWMGHGISSLPEVPCGSDWVSLPHQPELVAFLGNLGNSTEPRAGSQVSRSYSKIHCTVEEILTPIPLKPKGSCKVKLTVDD